MIIPASVVREPPSAFNSNKVSVIFNSFACVVVPLTVRFVIVTPELVAVITSVPPALICTVSLSEVLSTSTFVSPSSSA